MDITPRSRPSAGEERAPSHASVAESKSADRRAQVAPHRSRSHGSASHSSHCLAKNKHIPCRFTIEKEKTGHFSLRAPARARRPHGHAPTHLARPTHLRTVPQRPRRMTSDTKQTNPAERRLVEGGDKRKSAGRRGESSGRPRARRRPQLRQTCGVKAALNGVKVLISQGIYVQSLRRNG